MFEIRDERENVLDTRPTFAEAELRLEEICAEATEQAAASGEGTKDMTLSWTIYDTEAGALAGYMLLSPDDSGRPYVPISQTRPTRQEDLA
ncbi:hypothetical protein ACIBG7_43165 [Nonomuraea sp. NPDC050328]|uniref:hypothetical protein n=1 Tax=Nonomuraea sp. NPDC050328 TaxID=3364361 RepID=UPI0037B40104